jgi:hypothetical protein
MAYSEKRTLENYMKIIESDVIPTSVSEGSDTGKLILSIEREAKARGYTLNRWAKRMHNSEIFEVTYAVRHPGAVYEKDVLTLVLDREESNTVRCAAYPKLQEFLEQVKALPHE